VLTASSRKCWPAGDISWRWWLSWPKAAGCCNTLQWRNDYRYLASSTVALPWPTITAGWLAWLAGSFSCGESWPGALHRWLASIRNISASSKLSEESHGWREEERKSSAASSSAGENENHEEISPKKKKTRRHAAAMQKEASLRRPRRRNWRRSPISKRKKYNLAENIQRI